MKHKCYESNDMKDGEIIQNIMDYSLDGDVFITHYLTNGVVMTALIYSFHLFNLFQHNKLTDEQIQLAIIKGKCLDTLYEYQKLSEDALIMAILRNKNTKELFEYQIICAEAIELANQFCVEKEE